MSGHDLILIVFLCVAVMLNWVRARKSRLLRHRLAYSGLFLGLLTVSALAALLVTIRTRDPVALAGVVPFVLLSGFSHALDPVHKSAPVRTRLLLVIVPAIMILVALLINSKMARAFMDASPLALGVLVIAASTSGSHVAFKDFKNITGMTPDDDPWVDIDNPSVVSRRPREQFSDDAIWGRIILGCLLIVLLVVLAASLTLDANPTPGILWPFVPAGISVALALLASRVPMLDNVGRVPTSVYVLSMLAIAFSVLSVWWSSASMVEQSNLGVAVMAYRCVVGALVGGMWAEDFLVSFFLVNRIRAGRLEWLYALVVGLGWAALFVAASSVSYYDQGVFNSTWIMTNGVLLFIAYSSSVLAWRTIGSFIPRSQILTLKTPRDIALSDNTMFVALCGGCVVGVSMVTNGQNPVVAGAIAGLVFLFIFFASKNDQEHLRNEKARLMGENASIEIDTQKAYDSLVILRRHLRFQEVVPLVAVSASFLWAVVGAVM